MYKIKSVTDKFFNKGIFVYLLKKESPNILDKKEIIKLFEEYGFILFRNFDFKADNYKKFVDIYTKIYANDTNDTKRRKKTKISQYVRHVDAGNKKMSLHSEASFSPAWPEIVWFFCKTPSKENGETTVCDGIKLWDILSERTKNYFLSNPLKFKLKIPVLDKKKNGKKKNWLINHPGSYDAVMNYKTGDLHLKQIRFAINENKFLNKLCFSNHVLHKKPYIDKTIVKWGTIFNKKIPKKILKEVEEKAESITYYHKWKKNDLIMIDNQRFMHARNFFNKNDQREILNTQTLKTNF